MWPARERAQVLEDSKWAVLALGGGTQTYTWPAAAAGASPAPSHFPTRPVAWLLRTSCAGLPGSSRRVAL